jgi:hypothetical protein
MRARMVLLATVVCLTSYPAAAGTGDDDFESYVTDTFPLPFWNDAGLADRVTPLPPPLPSATIVDTTGANGQSTKALSFGPAVATPQGIIRSIPASSLYSAAADVRIDQYADNAMETVRTWPVTVGFSRFAPALNVAFMDNIGVYAATATQGWRLYAFSASYNLDIDLGAAAQIGQWYRIQVDIDVAARSVRAIIRNAQTSAILADVATPIPEADPDDLAFDLFTIVDGELEKTTTIPNLAVVDNVTWSASCTADFNGDGFVNSQDFFDFLTAFFAGC